MNTYLVKTNYKGFVVSTQLIDAPNAHEAIDFIKEVGATLVDIRLIEPVLTPEEQP